MLQTMALAVYQGSPMMWNRRNMAKLNKKVLKSLIKECLMEILTEAAIPQQASTKAKKRFAENKSPKDLDRDFLVAARKPRRQGPKVDVSQITDDPVMAAIFEDTAKTTLLEQAANETRTPTVSGTPAGNPGVEHVSSNLDSLFGDSTAKWADLAFREKAKK